MNDVAQEDWHEYNQRYLMGALDELRATLRSGPDRLESGTAARAGAGRETAAQIAAHMTVAPALERLCRTFGLSPFERGILLLCAGVELESSFAALVASVQGEARRTGPTFGLALAVLPEAHWSALNPAAPLRRWRLVEVEKGDSLTGSPLRIDERILHYLTGINHLDERLWGLVRIWTRASPLVPSHQEIVNGIVRIWSRAGETGVWPIVGLYGSERNSRRDVAAAVCRGLGLDLYLLSGQAMLMNPVDREATLRLWSREAALSSGALLLEPDETDKPEVDHPALLEGIMDQARGVSFVSTRERRKYGGRSRFDFEVKKPTAGEQQAIWTDLLAQAGGGADGWTESVVAQFNLDPQTIEAAGVEALGSISGDDGSQSGVSSIGPALWDACRRQARPKLDDLAQRIESTAGWNDLVLPGPQMEILRNIATHLRHRMRVYEHWGFAAKSNRGLGISALFAGESGTGKTLAAEVLANELHLDLYRIDLSQVVSKYIGETEKNLRRVFEAAEDGGAILLFDEADALFGKRSEVKDSHDRYANIEVSYLLQRMEAYRGLAVLTTNMKNALDTAFLRRLRFVVHFPFPDAAQRAEIWRRIFPADTPTEGLDIDKLARLNVAGGNIRNIALSAAFLAAETSGPVRMTHLARAVRSEYAKLERPWNTSEIAW